jgi:methionyl-tRNA formyltransferase
MRIVFMGTPAFAVPAFKALLQAHEVVAAYTQPPRPAGRGQKERKSPVQLVAEKAGIPVFTPVKLTDEKPIADIAVVAAYGLLLPEWFLKLFKYGCINIHPSALPRWRGAAPIQRTILAGDSETATCIMQMEKGLDTGPILKSEPLPVLPQMTSGQLHDLLAEKSVPLLLEVLQQIDSLTPKVQLPNGVIYAKKIEKSEARIHWDKSAAEIDCLVRGLNPTPGAYFEYAGERVKIWEAVFNTDGSGPGGVVLDDQLTIACGSGTIRPTLLQRAGGTKLSVDDFLRGFPLPKHSKL